MKKYSENYDFRNSKSGYGATAAKDLVQTAKNFNTLDESLMHKPKSNYPLAPKVPKNYGNPRTSVKKSNSKAPLPPPVSNTDVTNSTSLSNLTPQKASQ